MTSDFETTISNNGNPFDLTNKAVCLGVKINEEPTTVTFAPISVSPHNGLWIFFNAKFDIHWYRRLGMGVPTGSIWCCQIAEFILEGQVNKYPSLEQTAIKYELGHKIDVIKEEYWNKKIDTDQVPPELLSEYVIQDCDLTYKVYQKQLEQFVKQPKLFSLFKLMCQDLIVLQEMEWNGLLFDKQLCGQRSKELEEQLVDIRKDLTNVYPDININFSSGDQLSAFLYGGPIYYEEIEHVGFFKNGNPKMKKVEKWHTLPQMVAPLKGTGLKKEGFFATNEPTLRKLKGPAAKKFIEPLLKLAELEKLNNTYYKGLPKKNIEMKWPENKIHGQFNQCVAATGRLSSSGPNQQNFSGDCLDIFISRYAD